MTRQRWLWGLAATVAAVVVACATIKGERQRKPLAEVLRFPHATHVEEADCSDCHEGIAKSGEIRAGAFIGKGEHGGCGNCHEVDDKEECKKCHIGKPKDADLARRDRRLHFSHAKHVGRMKDGACKKCHPAAATAKRVGTNLVPEMKTCVASCHKPEMDSLDCAKCHVDLVRHPVKPIAEVSHDGEFLRRHGTLARNTARCATCHDQTYCARCHARTASMPLALKFPEDVQRRFIHRGDYIGRHPVEARAQPMTCRKCHGANFCATCHKSQGIAPPRNPSLTRTTTRQVHGPNFMTPGAPGFHGRAARRDINKCASCHDQGAASNCVKCHKVGGLGGNPHPAGFSWRNKQQNCRTNAMCLTCHTGGSGC